MKYFGCADGPRGLKGGRFAFFTVLDATFHTRAIKLQFPNVRTEGGRNSLTLSYHNLVIGMEVTHERPWCTSGHMNGLLPEDQCLLMTFVTPLFDL